jgi:hypothetical protein
VELLFFLTLPHTSGGRAHLISWCSSLPTSNVGLNSTTSLAKYEWALRDFFEIVKWAKSPPHISTFQTNNLKPVLYAKLSRLEKPEIVNVQALYS